MPMILLIVKGPIDMALNEATVRGIRAEPLVSSLAAAEVAYTYLKSEVCDMRSVTEWFHADDGKPPYAAGTLLFFSAHKDTPEDVHTKLAEAE